MQLSPEGKQHLEDVLTANAWTLEDLAEKSQFSISTIKKFSSGGTVHRKTFVTLCNMLDIDWKTASPQAIASTPSQPDKAIRSEPSSENLVVRPKHQEILLKQVGVLTFWLMLESYIQELEFYLEKLVRDRCCQNILNQHSRMRLLSGEEIGVDRLYVDVWLLEKPENRHFNSPNGLLSKFDIEKDRLALSKRIKRNPGFEIANENSNLAILGKPGSGKTTFLKHLAFDWYNGKFQPKLIAVLIELRRIQNEKWDLLNAVDEELGLNNWERLSAIQKEINTLQNQKRDEKDRKVAEQIEEQLEDLKQELESLPLLHLFKQGKILVLMDGLDEVPTNELRRKVQQQVKQVAKEYPNNWFIVTCRTQIMGSILAGFNSVEVADFSLEQVKQFVQNWFRASGQSATEAKAQWKKINRAIANQPALKELTVTPVLLSLMCLVLQDEGELPADRNWLYKKGIKFLLSRWNKEKQIESWEIGTETYRQLHIKEKETLLMNIAARKFENPENFVLFEEEELADQIAHQLQLNHRIEGIAVLKAIEAQHGLLIERADELWSFSHLTFQEHFTVQWLTQLPSEKLAEKLANQHWQEVVQQLVKSQKPADRLLRLIKQATDRSISHEPAMQTFLSWLLQKSTSAQVNYKPAAIRAFNYALALALVNTLDFDLAFNLDLDLSRALNLTNTFNRYRALDLSFDFTCYHARAHALAFALILGLDLTFTHGVAFSHERDIALTLGLDLAFNHEIARARALIRILDYNLDLASNLDLANTLHNLRAALPELENEENFHQWWQVNGVQWGEQLRQMMVEHRNMGHDWKFTTEQKQQLERYYDANKFLVDLMKIEGAVSENVRAEVEDTLLLPWDELQRRQSEPYRDRP